MSQTIQCPLQAGTPTHPRVVHSGQEGDFMIDAGGQAQGAEGPWKRDCQGLSVSLDYFNKISWTGA